MKKTLQEKLRRPPIGRIKRIDESIRSGKYPNAVTMGRELEVTDRTVKRDIEYLREVVQAPVAYDDIKHGYYYSKPYDLLAAAAVTGPEIFALLVADKAVAQYRGSCCQKPLPMPFEKLTGLLDERERCSPAKTFDPNENLKGGCTVANSGMGEEVVIEFDAWGANLVRSPQWYSSLEITELAAGGAVLRLRLNSLEEMERWVLSWGTHAKVLAPNSLKDRVRQTAAAVARAY